MDRDTDIPPPSEAVTGEFGAPNTPSAPASSNGSAGFIRQAWFDMLGRHCFADRELLMATARIGDASAVLPLVVESDRLVALANYYSFAYGPMFDGDPTPDIRFALLRRIAADLRARYHRVSLYPLVEEDTAALLRRAFAAGGWIALLTDQGENHVLDLRGRNFVIYWAQRPGALRSSVRRKGKAERYSFEIHETITDALWRDYTAVYAASWKNAEPWPAMIRSIADEAAARGVLRLGFAREEGRAVAVQLWTMEGRTACIHKLAHDSAEDAGSPGTLLSHHMFEHMIDVEKVAQIDYGTGGNAYKRDWMDTVRPMQRLDCFDPRKAALWLPALKTRISQLVRR